MLKRLRVDPLSLCSLRLTTFANGNPLSTATGFVMLHNERAFLITNWHVVSGRNAETGALLSSTGAEPDEVEILHRHVDGPGYWVTVRVRLRGTGGEHLWLSHPLGSAVDVVGLPLESSRGVAYAPVQMRWTEQDVLLEPGVAVSIIGYPYGFSLATIFPIWKIGHIASDPDINFDGQPAFLIDATTREGMSGSPVIYKVVQNYRNRAEEVMLLTTPGQVFCGVYSGRIARDSELGRVWRPEVITQILEQAA